jgi:polysaccharide pyruvyl transferase WcaK-like protein
MADEKRLKILLLDFCSEKNRGDAAMQAGLIELVYRNFLNPDVSIISVYGANQFKALHNEYDHSYKFPVTILGGLKPTFYPINENDHRSNFLFEFWQALNFLPSLLLLIAMKLWIPPSLIIRCLSREYRDTLKGILAADIVIWNGPNFRSRNNQILEIYRTFIMAYHPLLCGILSKSMTCVGVSVWGLNSPISRLILRLAFKECTFISVREENSYLETLKLVDNPDLSKVELLPDLSFAAMNDRKSILHKRRKISDTIYPRIIGLTIVDWKDEGIGVRNAYKLSIREIIDFFIEKEAQIVLIPQVTKKWESNSDLILEMVTASDNQKNITFIEGEPTVNELLSIYSNLDFLIATRMHSAIFAASVNTPFVAVAYDSGGKWGILDGLGYRDYIIKYKEITTEMLLNRILSCWKNKEQLLGNAEKKIDENIINVGLNVSKLIVFTSSKYN